MWTSHVYLATVPTALVARLKGLGSSYHHWDVLLPKGWPWWVEVPCWAKKDGLLFSYLLTRTDAEDLPLIWPYWTSPTKLCSRPEGGPAFERPFEHSENIP